MPRKFPEPLNFPDKEVPVSLKSLHDGLNFQFKEPLEPVDLIGAMKRINLEGGSTKEPNFFRERGKVNSLIFGKWVKTVQFFLEHEPTNPVDLVSEANYLKFESLNETVRTDAEASEGNSL